MYYNEGTMNFIVYFLIHLCAILLGNVTVRLMPRMPIKYNLQLSIKHFISHSDYQHIWLSFITSKTNVSSPSLYKIKASY
jgi:hypothetical protein